jgi:hypothetical protein
MSSLDSGHASYVLSGFIALQWELQRFLVTSQQPLQGEAALQKRDADADTNININDKSGAPRDGASPMSDAADATGCLDDASPRQPLLFPSSSSYWEIPPGLLRFFPPSRRHASNYPSNSSGKGCSSNSSSSSSSSSSSTDWIPGAVGSSGGTIDTPLMLRAFEMPSYTEVTDNMYIYAIHI